MEIYIRTFTACRTSADGPPHRGISELIVPMDSPGIEVRPIRDLTTNRHFCEVWFTDVEVPVANLVGVEGNAFAQTMQQLEHERGGIDRLVSNRPLYEMALARADRAATKCACTEHEQRVAAFAARVLGADATVWDPSDHSDVSRGIAYAPAYTIMGGTSNVMRNILGERVLGLPREPR